jgi:hypothetical protein
MSGIRVTARDLSDDETPEPDPVFDEDAMPEGRLDVDVDPLAPRPSNIVEPQTEARSLEERMKQRRDSIEANTTEKFLVPSYEDMLAVEFKRLSWDRMDRIADRNRKQPKESLARRYSAAEVILAATVGFHEVKEGPDGEVQYDAAEGLSWLALARAVNPKIREDATPRMALLNLIGEPATVTFYGLYMEWLTGSTAAEKELDADFA